MAIKLILDASIPQLEEPGFFQFFSTRKLAEEVDPADANGHYHVFADEPTRTVMLRPQQLDSSWLNTPQQMDSIVRLYDSAHPGEYTLVANPSDVTSQAIFEAPVFGNNANPYIWHVPVGPADSFPGGMMAPGAPPSLVGYSTSADATATDGLVRIPVPIYEPLVSVPFADDTVTPVQVGDTTDGKFIGGSNQRLPANAGLFFRWFHPASMQGFPCTYEFYIGQFKVRIMDVVVEVFRDTSEGGDRTAWKKVGGGPMYSVGDFSSRGVRRASVVGMAPPQTEPDSDRNLLWLPYRRNQILLLSSAGKFLLLQVNGKGKRLADDSDWDIVREDTLLVWVRTPAPGRFQVQRLKYPTGATLNSPTVTLDYTPASPPTITLAEDSDHGSTISATRSQPPSYSLPVNDADDCPAPTTTGTDQRREYGIVLDLASSSDRRWTPFFYGFTVTAPRTYISSLATPADVLDESPGEAVLSVQLTAGMRPGEGRMVAKVNDPSPYDLAPFYYRCAFPIQVDESGTKLFTGITEPTEVSPLKETAAPRSLTFSALDRWKQLADTYLRDQRDWTTYGHIDVVKFVCEQAGVDCTSAEFPAGYVAGTINTVNSALGGTEQTVAQQTKDVEPGWKPRTEDTAASYIQRVAELYSGWAVGFRLDGTFYYLPRDYYTAITATFAANHTGSAPYFYGAPTFTTLEPEANVILVRAGNAQDGQMIASSLWVDWQSIRNPAAVNYLGRWRAEVVTVGGTFTCTQLNWIARKVWEQTRRRRLTVTFDADFVTGLKVGQVCTLGSYGNYRITGFSVELTKTGFHRASYEGELVETGVEVV